MSDDKPAKPAQRSGILAPVLRKWLNNQPLDSEAEQALSEATEMLRQRIAEVVKATQGKE